MQLPARLSETLKASGWLPPWAQADPPGVDLLPAILTLWRHGTGLPADRKQRDRAERMIAWLDGQVSHGAQLTRGVPHADAAAVERWLGPRLVWWPHGVPPGRRLGLVSSRLGRRLGERRSWFTALRITCTEMDRQRDVLLTATATTTARFLERAGDLFGIRLIRLEAPLAGETPMRWLQRFRRARSKGACRSYCPAFLSPPLTPASTGPDRQDAPLRDRAVVAISDQVLVLHLRPKGHLDQLVRSRLGDPTWSAKSVRLALGPGLVPRSLADDLLAQGAVGWVVPGTAPERPPKQEVQVDPENNASPKPASEPSGHQQPASAAGVARSWPPAPIILVPPAENWDFLTHWTRDRSGPWPDESEDDYLDRLILSGAGVDRSAWAALRRIVMRQTIVATARTIRGGTPVVSLTAVPLAELPGMRVFRPHRGRWDFEPYGVCIRRAWLQQRGARAVRYGDEAEWHRISPADRPFFQLRTTRPRGGRPPIDWTLEREWRHPSDVDLRELRPDEGMLFVPSRNEAEQLARLSRWPIVVLA